MVPYEKIYVPDKYEIEVPSNPPDDTGEIVQLELGSDTKDEHRTRLLSLVSIGFILVAILTIIYAAITGNDQMIVMVFQTSASFVLMVLAYYFGRTHGESKKESTVSYHT